jgi:O-antigen ligase
MGKRTAITIILFIIIAILTSLVAFYSVPWALALMFGLAIAILVFSRPFFGLIFYILLIYIMPHAFFPPLRKFRIMLVLAILVLLVFIFHKVVRKEGISGISSRHDLFMVLLLLAIPASNVFNFRLGAAWDGFYEFLTVFLLYYILVSLTEDFEKLRKVYVTLIICTVMMTLNGLLQHFRGYDIAGIPPLDGRIRWRSHFGDPNDFALAINTFLPFVLVNLFEKDIGRFKKAMLLGIACIFLVGIYYTNSRGGYVALILILAVFSLKRWGLLRGLIAAAVFVAAALVLAPSRMAELSPQERSASGRIYAWIGGLEMLKSHPLFGIGHGNFQIFHTRAAHSAFIQCVSELGLVGYFIWLTLIYSSFAGLRRVEKHASAIYAKYAKILQLSMLGFLASAFFLSQAYHPILYMLFALSSLVIRFAEPSVSQSRGIPPRDLWRIAGITVGSVIALKAFTIIFA